MLNRKKDSELTSSCLTAADLNYVIAKLTSSPNTQSSNLPLDCDYHLICQFIRNWSKFCLGFTLRYQVVATFDKLLARYC